MVYETIVEGSNPSGCTNLFEKDVDMQVDEIVKIKDDCPNTVTSHLKKCWFQIKSIKDLFPQRIATLEVYSNPAFTIKNRSYSKKIISTRIKKNSLKGTIYTIDMKYLTGD